MPSGHRIHTIIEMLGLRRGFATIGNATLVVLDEEKPILVTDPWIKGSPYFGSWKLSHEIPAGVEDAILKTSYVWFSHGHPDHLNGESLSLFKGKKILLADHCGQRICNDLRASGFDVSVLPDRKWVSLSEHIRILSISDINQDSILLIDINGRLVVNLNDAADHGWGSFVQKTIRQYETSYLLAIAGFGEADMINFFDEDGNRSLPSYVKRYPISFRINQLMKYFGTRYFIPFSSLHSYQRSDSVWANDYVARLEDYGPGFDRRVGDLLPAFLLVDCETDQRREINPTENQTQILEPSVFGDSWDEEPERSDWQKIESYFKKFSHLATLLDFVRVKIGGKEYTAGLKSRGFNRGLTFEAPRHSFMTAIEYEIFDDLLIGNFMKTTAHGKWEATTTSCLYPNFTPYVTKYGDNGRAHSAEELRKYRKFYRDRALFSFLKHAAEQRAIYSFQRYVPRDSKVFRLAKRFYQKHF